MLPLNGSALPVSREAVAIRRSITAITANNPGMARPLITTHLNDHDHDENLRLVLLDECINRVPSLAEQHNIIQYDNLSSSFLGLSTLRSQSTFLNYNKTGVSFQNKCLVLDQRGAGMYSFRVAEWKRKATLAKSR
jgi:hypothetical protein